MRGVPPVPTAHNDERRWTLGAWLTLALAVGYIVGAIVYVLFAFGQSTDGWLYSSGLDPVVFAQHSQSGTPSPLRPGDEFLTLDGVPVPERSYRPLPPPAGWQVGGIGHYAVRRNEATLDLDVPLVARPASALVAYIWGGTDGSPMQLLNALCWYAIGFGVFWLRPRSTAARLLLLIVVYWTTIDAILSADSPISATFYTPVLFWCRYVIGALWPLLFAMATHLVLAFPVLSKPLVRWPRRTLGLLYGLPVISLALETALASDALKLGCLFLMMLVFIVALIATTVANLRNVRDSVVRAQIGWVALGLCAPFLSAIIFQSAEYLSIVPSTAPDWIWQTLALLLPLCLGIAILRYQLFDIEVIIRRTLIYSVLTLALGATYVVGVAVLQALLVRLTGQESTLAVVASTLAIAALFVPLRRRVQALIDRRFYRKKYDARQVLEAFALRAQQEGDIDALAADIIGVVQDTLQPEHVRLWLVPSKEQRP